MYVPLYSVTTGGRSPSYPRRVLPSELGHTGVFKPWEGQESNEDIQKLFRVVPRRIDPKCRIAS